MTCQRGAGGRRGAVAFSAAAAAAAGLPALLRLQWHHLHRCHDAREWMPWWQPPLSREPWRQELALLRCHAVCLFMCVCAHTFSHQLNYTEAVLFNFILKHCLILISTTRQDSKRQSHIKACVWTGSTHTHTHTQTTSQQRKHTNGCSLRPRRLWFKGPQELPITTGHFNQTWSFCREVSSIIADSRVLRSRLSGGMKPPVQLDNSPEEKFILCHVVRVLFETHCSVSGASWGQSDKTPPTS